MDRSSTIVLPAGYNEELPTLNGLTFGFFFLVVSQFLYFNRNGKVGAVTFYFRGLQNQFGLCSHEIKRYLLLGRKVTTNLDNILESRDITLLRMVCIVKAMVFPVVMY